MRIFIAFICLIIFLTSLICNSNGSSNGSTRNSIILDSDLASITLLNGTRIQKSVNLFPSFHITSIQSGGSCHVFAASRFIEYTYGKLTGNPLNLDESYFYTLHLLHQLEHDQIDFTKTPSAGFITNLDGGNVEFIVNEFNQGHLLTENILQNSLFENFKKIVQPYYNKIQNLSADLLKFDPTNHSYIVDVLRFKSMVYNREIAQKVSALLDGELMESSKDVALSSADQSIHFEIYNPVFLVGDNNPATIKNEQIQYVLTELSNGRPVLCSTEEQDYFHDNLIVGYEHNIYSTDQFTYYVLDSNYKEMIPITNSIQCSIYKSIRSI